MNREEEILNKLKEEGFCFNQSKEHLVIRTVELVEQEAKKEFLEFLKELLGNARYENALLTREEILKKIAELEGLK